MAEPARVWDLLRPWLTPDDAELIRAVVYRFHATVAERVSRALRHFLPTHLSRRLDRALDFR